MARPTVTPAWQTSLVLLTGTVLVVVVTACLYWAQAICVPIALALFLTFVLTPAVRALQRRGLGRTPSVLVVVLVAALVLSGIGWVVGAQARSLIAEAPMYTENVGSKIKSLRQMVEGPATKRLGKVAEEIAGELDSRVPAERRVDASGEETVPSTEPPPQPTAVVAQSNGSTWLSRLPTFLGELMEALGGLALVSVLLIFMLLKREDLRNRFIRLIGHGRITTTTKALDDAAHRLSRYLLAQLMVNSMFGLAIALGLWAIGMRHAFLWGFLATTLRYVPYIGPWIAALGPILLSLAMFPGWLQPLLVVGLFTVCELITNNVIEPHFYGHSIGVSETALLIAAAFWAFLWGPIGLILSSPLTVCVVVLGKYVPHLEFLDVLMGDEPVMAPDLLYYQRILAHDEDEATGLVLAHVKTHSVDEVYDQMLVPALNHFKRDRQRGELSDEDEAFLLQATRNILEEDLADDEGEAAEGAEDVVVAAEARSGEKTRIIACPARDQMDRLALDMLRRLLDPARWDVEIVAVETLTSEVVTRVAQCGARLVCIAALPPGGLAHTRYLCKRLRARFPEIKIVVGRWGSKVNLDRNRRQLQEVGVDMMATTLLETRNQLNSLLPILAQRAGSVEALDRSTENIRSLELVEGADGQNKPAPLAIEAADQ